MDCSLRERVRKRLPCVGACVGSGMTAQAAEAGGADFLLTLNAGYFRMQGCSSMAALMPYANANALTWSLAEQQVLPRVRRAPVLLGVCAQDPSLDAATLLSRARAAGMVGITNFPSVGFIDGSYRRALEESGLGYDREIALLRKAREAGLFTVAFAFDAAEAVAMAEAGTDILCLDLGFAEWREVSQEEHQAALDGAVRHIAGVLASVRAVNPEPYAVVLGGPVTTPSDTALLYQHADVQGFIGGSAIERFPAAPLITQTVAEFKRVAESGHRRQRFGAMMGVSEAMQRVFQTIERVADTDAPVLILGESGTGKELAARELHRLSRRRSGPMVCWNCAALTETLAMSELFGHEKGAFTGATHRHPGRFEQAHHGTLFMDEVTELPVAVQASLLRVLQEREVVRVGGTETVSVDVRSVAASNRDVAALVRDGRFRLDLYYRLNTIVLRIPPLRERMEDIPMLVREMAHEFSHRYGYPMPEVPSSVVDSLTRHTWPGNVRELRNAVERCVIMGRGERFRTEWLSDLRQPAAAPLHDFALRRRTAESLHVLRDRLADALHRHHGNKSAAARELGVTRKTLYDWLGRIEKA